MFKIILGYLCNMGCEALGTGYWPPVIRTAFHLLVREMEPKFGISSPLLSSVFSDYFNALVSTRLYQSKRCFFARRWTKWSLLKASPRPWRQLDRFGTGACYGT
jgi:hypothetical protein